MKATARHMEAAKFLSQIAAWKASCLAAEAEVAELRELLARARLAIGGVRDRAVFGIGGEGVTHWYLADVLLADIDEALS